MNPSAAHIWFNALNILSSASINHKPNISSANTFSSNYGIISSAINHSNILDPKTHHLTSVGIRLCTSNSRNNAAYSSFIGFRHLSDSQRSSSIYRSYSIYGYHPITSGLLVLSLTVLSATPRSLYLYSSFLLLRLTGALFTGRPKIIPTCVQLDLSYFLQSYKTHIFRNALILLESYWNELHILFWVQLLFAWILS
jgi:hypothetical protein